MWTLNLDGTWDLYYQTSSIKPVGSLSEAKKHGYERCRAVVPGNVEIDLMANGKLPDLYVGDHITKAWDLEYGDWWYTREFSLPDDFPQSGTVFLVFDGVDTIADVYLNEQHLCHLDNMLVEHEVPLDVSTLKCGSNTLTVHIQSALREADKYDYNALSVAEGMHNESLWIRKAPSMYGWDIMPRIVSAGLWKSVRLVVKERPWIEDCYVFTKSANVKQARVGLYYQLSNTPARGQYELRVQAMDADGSIACEQSLKPHFKSGSLDLVIDNPRLWWPKGYGTPELYQLVVAVVGPEGEVDRKEMNLGIRDLVIEHENLPGDDGKFVVHVNGKRIFVLGTNWVPLDALHSRDRDRLDEALALLGDVGCNAVRCWGGNVYESDDFFDWCDKNGVLVWQDFTFACARYPLEREFAERVRAEAIKVVKRLRNHPSLLLWCGNNENDQNFAADNYDPNQDTLSREVLKSVCYMHDPARYYLPTSPYYSPEVWNHPTRFSSPDQHLWGPRANYKGDFYKHNTAWFVSEIGYHGLNRKDSLMKFLTPDHIKIDPTDPVWILHETDHTRIGGRRGYSRIQLLLDQAHLLFPNIGDDLDAVIKASQIVQAEAFKYFVESSRLRQPRCSGILWWNLLDGWPQISDAVVDYYFAKKLAYFYLKRSQVRLSVIVDEAQGWTHDVYLLNDGMSEGEVHYQIYDVDTHETLLEGTQEASPGVKQLLGRFKLSLTGTRFLAVRWTHEGVSYGSHYLDAEGPLDLDQYVLWLSKAAAFFPEVDLNAVWPNEETGSKS